MPYSVGEKVLVSDGKGAILKGEIHKVRPSQILTFEEKEYCPFIVLREGLPAQGESHACDHCMHGCVMKENEVALINTGMLGLYTKQS